jgi:hypothetical protein
VVIGFNTRLVALGAVLALLVAGCAMTTADQAATEMRASVAATATEFGLADHVGEIAVSFTQVPCSRAGGTAALAVLDVVVPPGEFEVGAIALVGGFWAEYHGRDFVRVAALPGAPDVVGVEGILRNGETLGFVYSVNDSTIHIQGLSGCLPRKVIDE